MKYLILLLLPFTLFSYDKFVKLDSCETDQVVYNGPHALQVCGENCVPVLADSFNCAFTVLKEAHNTKTNIVSCIDESDCQTKLVNHSCAGNETAIKNLDSLEVYCSEFIPRHFGIDQEKKRLHDLAIAKKESQEQGINAAQKAIEHGRRVIALVSYQNARKQLSEDQVKAMVLTFSDIVKLLESGALQTAKNEILKINPDGNLLTQENISEIIEEINKFFE